jgi:hypothetical protein
VEKIKLYSDQLNRFLTFKNKMDVSAQAPAQTTPLVPAEILPQVPPTPVPAEIPPPVPATPKPNFLICHQQNRNDQNSSTTFFTIG